MDMTDLDLESRSRQLLSAFPIEFLSLERDEQVASVKLYRLLAEGSPVSSQQLAASADIAEGRISEMLDGWPGVCRDEDQRVVGYWGLALAETDHSIEVDGRELFAWCAWDTLFLPEILGKPAAVKSKCPISGQDIRLIVTPEGIEGEDPAKIPPPQPSP